MNRRPDLPLTPLPSKSRPVRAQAGANDGSETARRPIRSARTSQSRLVSSDHIAGGGHGPSGAHVVVSELSIDEVGIASLEAAFSDRLGEVDSFPGHLGLQVWRDNQKPGRYLMVTWWETEDDFRQYMQSESHRCSHARIPAEPARPKAVRVSRFTLVSE